MEDKIEVGEYIRTKKGYIRQVIKRDVDNHILLDIVFEGANYLTQIDEKENIVKHSKNIIDLIENDDCLIYKIRGSDILRKGFVRKHIDLETNREYLSIEFYSLKQIEILGIVTKEQFKSIEYNL